MTFRTLRTVKLGTGPKTANDIVAAIKDVGRFVTNNGDSMLHKPGFKTHDQETDVDLIEITNAELGFAQGATVEETHARGKQFGLDLCHSEVGPKLAIQYKDQPKGQNLLIAMEFITGDGGRGKYVFTVGRRLGAEHGGFGAVDISLDTIKRSPDTRWVFQRRKQ